MALYAYNNSGGSKTWAGQVVPDATYYLIEPTEQQTWAKDNDVVSDVGLGNCIISTSNDSSGHQTVYLGLNLLQDIKQIFPVTSDDGRQLAAVNRIPAGYSLYITGKSDGISAGTYRTGDSMKFSSSDATQDLRQLKHYYVIGVRAIYSGCSLDNYFEAKLLAPASSGFTNSTGDYDKVEIIPSSGLHLFKPVSAGTGAWTGTLTDKIGSSNVLKATPVPVAGNTGWFDYDPTSNALTANMDQEGGYNLYDFDANLHQFAAYTWASPTTGHESSLDIEGLVGKLIYNSWIIRLDFKKDGGSLSSEEARLNFILGSQGNV